MRQNVLIVPWTSPKMKVLKKIIDATYPESQFNVDIMKYSMFAYFAPPSISSTLIKRENKDIFKDTYDIVHIFSAGSVATTRVFDSIQTTPTTKWIFDSSLTIPVPENIARATGVNLQVLRVICSIIWPSDIVEKTISDFEHKLCKYKDHVMIMHGDLEEYDIAQFDKSDIRQVTFENTKHLDLFRNHSKYYVDNVHTFINSKL